MEKKKEWINIKIKSLITTCKGKEKRKHCFLLAIGVFLLVIIANLFLSVMNIEKYSIIQTVKNITSENISNTQIRECRTYHYIPDIVKVIYEEDTKLREESIVVYCDLKSQNAYGKMVDGEYVYVYDMDGNIITYFEFGDRYNHIDDFINTFVSRSYLTKWYDWKEYSKKDILNACKKNAYTKKYFLTSKRKESTPEAINGLLHAYIQFSLDSKYYDEAQYYTFKLTDKELKKDLTKKLDDIRYKEFKSYLSMDNYEDANQALDKIKNKEIIQKCKEELDNAYYEDGLALYESGDSKAALEILTKINDNKKADKIIDDIKLEEEYQTAIEFANNHEYEKAKSFFEKHQDYKDSKKFLECIAIAEQSKWEGYWIKVKDDTISKNCNSHLCILSLISSNDSTIKNIHGIKIGNSWNTIKMYDYYKSHGTTWKEEGDLLVQKYDTTKTVYLKLEGDKLIWNRADGTCTYQRDTEMK